MHNLKLFDLHCDTLYEARKQNKSLLKNNLCLDFERLSEYDSFCQVLAMWSDKNLDGDTAYKHFFEAHKILSNELENQLHIKFCTSNNDLTACEKAGNNAVFLAVEGGKLICEDISRLEVLYNHGVRFLTLVWNDFCKIGGSAGCAEGISKFGIEVLKTCFSLGIIPDVSHSSDSLCDDVISLCEEAGKVAVATHSNSRALCNHVRNLTDERFVRISKLGGIVGISLAPMHLCEDEKADISTIASHIEHYVSLGGENTVCLGCDLDGVSTLPSGINSVSDLYKIADFLGGINYSDDLIKKIFFYNARNFVLKWVK